MPEEVFETPQPTESKPTNWPKIILVAVLGFVLLSGAAYAGYWYGTRQTKPIEEPAASKIELPKNNLLAYTRCSGDERYPDNCQLYVSELFKSDTEKATHTFDFPDMSDCHQCPAGAFSIRLHGVVGNKVIYTKLFSKRISDKKYISVTKLGFVDLENGENTIIFDNYDDGVDDKRYLLRSSDHWPHPHILVDRQNNKVYYSITSLEVAVVQYDLSSRENSTILSFEVDRTAPPKNNYVVAFASDEFLYLADVSGRSGTFNLAWKVRITDGDKQEFPKAMDAPKISSDGKKIAYVEEDNQNIYLRVMSLEKEEDVEIISTEKLKYPESAGFSDIGFSISGDILTAKMSKSTEDTKSFAWFANQFSTEYTVEPADVTFEWVEFMDLDSPASPYKVSGVLYEEDAAWFLSRFYTSFADERKIDLLEGRKAVLTSVEDVLLIP